MSRNRLFGLETEYAFSALGRNGQRLDRSEWSAKFMDHAARKLPNLPDKSAGGMFLASGGRFYRDSGNHPELTTPEVTNPWDVCRYVDAGDRLMKQVAEGLAQEYRETVQFVLNRTNVAYGPGQSTWACHESYGHRASPERFPEQLIPHLVSRLIYTGSGGFNNRTPGIEFLISPRVAHIQQSISDRSQSDRGVFHTKDEPLSSSGNHRLHVLCGDSVCSHLSNWLRVATTAIVVAMIEAGESPGQAVVLRDPVSAMLAYSRDTTLRAPVFRNDPLHKTALQIQRQYLAQAERCADRDFMPPWTGQALTLWRETLDKLDQGQEAVSRSLDWSIKLGLFQQAASRLGIEWNSIGTWSLVLIRLTDALIQGGHLTPELRLSPRGISPALCQPGGPIGSAVSDLLPLVREQGLEWTQLPKVVQLRQQLLALDTRFSEIGSNGVFANLDAAGVLEHRVPGVDNIEHAMTHPPQEGRAKLRGETIRRNFERRNDFSVNWSTIIDESQRRVLDLSDPFTQSESWRDIPAPVADPATATQTDAAVLQRATECYIRGEYEVGSQLLQARLVYVPRTSPHYRQMLRMMALLAARRGQPTASQSMLTATAGVPESLSQIVDWICIYRFLTIAPHPEMALWIERGLRRMADHPGREPNSAAVFRDHYAVWLMGNGRLLEAKEQLESARIQQPPGVCLRVYSRMLVSLAEIERRMNNATEGHRLSEIAERIQTEKGFHGDLAELTLPMRARLELNQERRLLQLARARTLNAGRCPIGRVRGLLLEARVRREPERAEAIRTEILDVQGRAPSLRNCVIVQRLLDNWDLWSTGIEIPGATEYFAGV